MRRFGWRLSHVVFLHRRAWARFGSEHNGTVLLSVDHCYHFFVVVWTTWQTMRVVVDDEGPGTCMCVCICENKIFENKAILSLVIIWLFNVCSRLYRYRLREEIDVHNIYYL